MSIAMQKRRSFLKFGAAFLAFCFYLPRFSSGQMVIGQYEDEAPLRTWNIFGFQGAAAVGRGDASFAVAASDPSAGLANPALLVDLSGLRLVLNGMAMSTALRKFSIINTGVLASDKNFFLYLYGVDMAGFSFSKGGWGIAFNVYLSEIYDRPPTGYEYFYRGQLYYRIHFNQDGFLRTYHFSLARKLGPRFRAGIGFNFAGGELNRRIEEEWAGQGIIIGDTKKQKFSGFFMNGGLLARLTEKLDLAVVFRTPYPKKSPSESKIVYDAPPGGMDITIAGSATSQYDQPFVLGMGASYLLSSRLRVAIDASFFNWESYRVEYFEEEIERDFRNTIKAAVGAEFEMPLRFLQTEATVPLRVGFGYEQQPMKEPHSAYTFFSAGLGCRWRMIALDCGACWAWESGSGDSLEARRIALSLTLKL